MIHEQQAAHTIKKRFSFFRKIFCFHTLFRFRTTLLFIRRDFFIQVVPGEPGAEVSGEKNYKPKKDFAYRMCARKPTSAMPKPSFCVHQPSAVPSGGGVLVAAGCVSMVRRWW